MINSVQKIQFGHRSSRIDADRKTKKKIRVICVNPWRFLSCSARKRQQCNVARLLDRQTQPALVRRAHSRQAARHNFAALGDELRQQANVFVIDRVYFLGAEFADFLATEKFPSAGSAFAPARAGRTPFSAV